MTSYEIDEAVFDSILKLAFLDALRHELDNMIFNDISIYYPTKKHKKATRRAFKLIVRK